MMGFKKVLIGIILLLAFVLAACSSGDGKDAGGDGKKVSINYYTWKSGAAGESIKEKIANFEKEHPNIEVNYEALVNGNDTVEYNKKLDIKMGTGQPIDVVAFSHVDFLVERAARGVLAPIDENLQKDAIDPEEEFYITPTYKGNTYGVQDLSSPWFIAINKDALDKADLPVPDWGWTWDDFKDYAKKLTTGDQYGAYFHTWGEYDNFIAYSELPHPYLTKDEQPVFGDDSFKQFFELRRDMEKAGSTKKYKDVLAGKLHYATEFFNEEAAMLPTASFIVDLIKDEEKYPHDFKTVFAPLPQSSEDTKAGATYTGGQYLAIGESSEHKEEAYEFIRYMSQQTDVVNDFPGSKNVDQDVVVDKMIGDSDDLIDKESLVNTVFDDRVYIPYDTDYATDYASQLKSVLEDGFSKFILDGTSAEEAQEWMNKQANDIISKSKK